MRRVVGCAALMIALWAAPSAHAAFKPVAAATGVTPGFAVGADVKGGVLRTLRIDSTGAGVIKWRCSGPCRRTGGPPERITHPKGATVIHRLNLRMLKGTSLMIDVVVPSGQSRFLRVAARNRRPVVTAAGCLDGQGRRGACPAPVTLPSPPGPGPSAPVPPAATPAATVTPEPTIMPPPTVAPPVNNPDGALEKVTRVGTSHARVSGWASDADVASAAITVRSLVEGAPAAEAAAGLVHAQFSGHGFNFLVPIDDRRRNICVVAVNVGGGSDRLLRGCRAVPELADLNDDGYVGCVDQQRLLARYGQNGVELPEDLNNNGTVEIMDLSMLLSRFRPPPAEPKCPSLNTSAYGASARDRGDRSAAGRAGGVA
ncbi:hypothetical protein DVA67_008990 [Solirubrobacter sp. CPCC 204708]|uniref:Dockerin domain-containing protein n=1 Tax=Solirubrobacter deserti TaxID=2282478 RepID=A0ABT4RE90_9ACTN|nr:hypothetical protein [Solirubrobacter deserti]MBE2316110.1 hypothetical protein [Solirubrobacter deserti]MDA0136860.1 hypothetical protein [Solirubrobacter deserti]